VCHSLPTESRLAVAPSTHSVALFGATGLVGRHCLELLTADGATSRIIVAGRRRLPDLPRDPRIVETVIDFDELTAHRAAMRADAIICALGTTIKKAGTRDRFRMVDHDYPLAIARLGLEEGARHFLLVSAIGANPDSRVFYNQVKGEVERDLCDLPYPAITIVRPSLLLGERHEFRLGEEVAKRFRFFLPGKYRPVHARTVAQRLVHESERTSGGVRVIESSDLRQG
jgi:uncharacterized protein YbjT (DUF2867 family)